MHKRYNPVNWADGMKINKAAFLDQDNAVTYQLAQNTAALINDYNYGLLPAAAQNVPGVKLYMDIDNQRQVNLRLLQCRILTRGGYFIEFNEDESLGEQRLVTEPATLCVALDAIEQKVQELLVVISINPFKRVPFGLPDVEETPPRVPYTRPELKLSLVALQDVSANTIGAFSMPVGLLKISGSRVMLDDRYIPPCSSVNSHFDLIELHAAIEQFYSRMELYSLQIIQKIIQKKQSNEMAGIVLKLCENLVVIISNSISEIRTVDYIQPPFFIITRMHSIANIIRNTLDFYSGAGKEEFVNYCEDWCNTNRGVLEAAIVSLHNNTYNHLDITRSIEKISDFISIISNLFMNLSALDYIGKRRDAGIFVKEHAVVADQDEPRKKRIYLAD